ncbi:Protein HIT1 [Meyerozyma sp. JA9]|nr:Protein HIT1 [Meyerozyma sp. JA9]
MICGICNENEAKYRCPRCNVHYCSLVCFKGPNHVHLEAEKPTQADKPETDANQKSSIKNESANNSNLFGRIASDPQIQSMLKYKSLQFHLSVISKILDDPQISGEQTTAGRREVANAKLTQLRGGGSEENELVEDFAARVLEIMEENKREK